MKQNQLRDYFPMLKSKNEILEIIEKDAHFISRASTALYILNVDTIYDTTYNIRERTLK